MGPRTIVRGNSLLRYGRAGKARGFNGAADDRPRKSEAPDRSRTPAGRFNGAADDRPRKSAAQVDILRRGALASMGPRTIVRGNPVLRALGRDRLNRFNGAADDRPRKYPAHRGDRGALRASMGPRTIVRGNSSPFARFWIVPVHSASMGPRTIVRGNWTGCHRRRWPSRASMGPRTIVRGNGAGQAGPQPERRQLQWGRGRSSAEMRSTKSARSTSR